MAIINCPECGKEISDKAAACPNCGCPADEFLKIATVKAPDLEVPKVTKHNGSTTNNFNQFAKYANGNKEINIVSLILQAIRWIFAAFIVLIAISLFIAYGFKGILTFLFLIACGFFISPLHKKLPLSMPAAFKIAIPIILFFAAIMATPAQDVQPSTNTDEVETEIILEESEIESGAQEPTIVTETKENPSESQNTEMVEPESLVESEIVYTDIFDLNLRENWSSYVDQYIRTAFEVGRCVNGSIESSYDNSYLKVYPDNYRDFESGDYIVVTGKVSGKDGSDIEIVDAHIEKIGTDAISVYNEGLSAYNKQKEIEAAEYESDFKKSAESVSYENLARYPETYEGKEVKISVSITQVQKKDSLLFADSYIAKMSGNEIAIYDKRELKEPKLLEGDKVIIYGRGNGLTEIKTYDKSGIIPKTIDTRKIPAISVEFIEFK